MEALTVDKNITLDLNGQTITASINDAIQVTSGTFTLKDDSTDKNGAINSSSYNAIKVTGEGTVFNFESGTITSTSTDNYAVRIEVAKFNMSGGKISGAYGALRMASGAEANITGEAELTAENSADDAYGIVVGGNCTLNIGSEDEPESETPTISAKYTGSEYGKGGVGISGNGSNNDAWNDSYITIYSGKITGAGGESLGIYHPQVDGWLEIYGGEISGGTGIEVRAGSNLSVSGGTIKGTATEYSSKANGNGATTQGAGIAIAQHTTKEDIITKITGGDISGLVGLSITNPQGAEDGELVAVSVKTGDDGETSPTIKGTSAAIFYQDARAKVTLANGTIDGAIKNTYTNSDGVIRLGESGSQTTDLNNFTFSSDNNIKFNNKENIPSDFETVEDEGEYKIAVAKVTTEEGTEETTYASLSEAIEAAGEGDTVTLLANISLVEYLYIESAITLDLNGHTIFADETSEEFTYFMQITGSATLTDNSTDGGGTIDLGKVAGGIISILGDEVTISNITIKKVGDVEGTCIEITGGSTTLDKIELHYKGISSGGAISNGAGLTIKNSTIDVDSSTEGGENGTAIDSTNSESLTIENSTVSIKGESCTAVFTQETNATFNGATITADGENSTGIDNFGSEDKTLTLTNSSVTASGEGSVGLNNQTTEPTINVNGSSISGETAYVQGEAGSGESNNPLTFAATVTKDGTIYYYTNLENAIKGAEEKGGTLEVLNPGEDAGDNVALIVNGETTNYYATLQDAVNAVESGGTVTLLKDASGGGIATYTNGKTGYATAKNFTIDFGGHTYTVGNPAVGSTGTESQAFHLEKGSTTVNVTFKNGTINVADNETFTGSMLLQNYCNLTLDGMTIDGTNLKNAGTGQYVSSNNCGTVTINNTKIIAKNGDWAFDVCSAPNVGYSEGTKVTVKGNSEITGNIELGLWGTQNDSFVSSLTIEGGTITGKIVDASGNLITTTGLSKVLAISGGTVNGTAYESGKSVLLAETSESKTTYNLGTQGWDVTNAASGKYVYTTAADETSGLATKITVTGLKTGLTTTELVDTNIKVDGKKVTILNSAVLPETVATDGAELSADNSDYSIELSGDFAAKSYNKDTWIEGTDNDKFKFYANGSKSAGYEYDSSTKKLTKVEDGASVIISDAGGLTKEQLTSAFSVSGDKVTVISFDNLDGKTITLSSGTFNTPDSSVGTEQKDIAQYWNVKDDNANYYDQGGKTAGYILNNSNQELTYAKEPTVTSTISISGVSGIEASTLNNAFTVSGNKVTIAKFDNLGQKEFTLTGATFDTLSGTDVATIYESAAWSDVSDHKTSYYAAGKKTVGYSPSSCVGTSRLK